MYLLKMILLGLGFELAILGNCVTLSTHIQKRIAQLKLSFECMFSLFSTAVINNSARDRIL